ncbi:MAG: ABC-F family ATP-binding cassette domain-containing protein [Chloroherpetonaceae bacterium]|nr:ABC-F family ATP-binding cassette domain-containing protein [Chthonomonadaceae bacterium]MDW8208728.1 ABC-F family ATP-binding cassette domain-containing protein [Chloroherpetonaceae bacterium]
MSFLLSCQSLSRSVASRPLFRDITFGITGGERVGLIGPNGAGKSTLLRTLAGLEPPDSGVVSMRRGLRVSYVAQQDTFPADATVHTTLLGALVDSPLDLHEQQQAMRLLLTKIGFPEEDQSVNALSGGWRKRLSIARALIRDPDLLLLDEPTNHLDIEGVLWLEETLLRAPFAVIMITHDRYFLEKVATRIVELSRQYRDGYLSVEGNYSHFLEEKEAYLQAQWNQQSALETQARREIEWLRSNAEARRTKAQSRIREANRLLAELAELRTRNAQGQKAVLDFTVSGRRTRQLLVAQGLRKSLGDRLLFDSVHLALGPGVKLGLLGPNGSGKTTLLRLLTGEITPDQGTIVRAEGLRTVYLDQHRATLDPNQPLRHALAFNSDYVRYRGTSIHVAAWAKRFLFAPEQLEQPVGALSGGEQARVLIARLMLEPADLLILDEPTNDLDIPSLEVLEESLVEFSGALVLVTHDRYLLDRVANLLLALDGAGHAEFFADYAQWEQKQRQKQTERTSQPSSGRAPISGSRGLSAAERRELARMEETILAAEAEVERLREQMNTPEIATDPVKLQACWEEHNRAVERVTALYARWEELERKRAG